MYAGPISRLIAELSRLPGIGQRTAQRLAFHILRSDDDEAFESAKEWKATQVDEHYTDPIADPAEIQANGRELPDAGFKASAFLPSYGLAEATLAVTVMPPGEGIRVELVEEERLSGAARDLSRPARYRAIVNCGKPLPDMDVEIRGENVDEAGEIVQKVKLPETSETGFALFAQDSQGIAPSGNEFRRFPHGNVLEIEPRMLAYQLAFFAGFLLYIGASDLLPHGHERPRFALIFSTIAGLATAGLMVWGLEQLH